MPYVSNVPKGGDVRSATQPTIQGNFQTFSDVIDVNHTGFSSATPGLHSLITFTQQLNDPDTLAGQMALYAKAIDDPNRTGLFARYPSNGRVVQVDGSVVNDGSGGQVLSPINSLQGWQYISGGLLMKWGYGGPVAQSPGVVTYTFSTVTPVPAFRTTPFHIEAQPQDGGGGLICIQAINNLSYSVTQTGSTTQFLWMAIGT